MAMTNLRHDRSRNGLLDTLADPRRTIRKRDSTQGEISKTVLRDRQ